MLPCFDEFIVEKNLPLRVNEFPMTESREWRAGVKPPCLLCGNVLEMLR